MNAQASHQRSTEQHLFDKLGTKLRPVHLPTSFPAAAFCPNSLSHPSLFHTQIQQLLYRMSRWCISAIGIRRDPSIPWSQLAFALQGQGRNQNHSRQTVGDAAWINVSRTALLSVYIMWQRNWRKVASTPKTSRKEQRTHIRKSQSLCPVGASSKF